MSITPRLQTNLVADRIKGNLSDLNDQELIPSAQYNKSISFARLIDAINKADMSACRMIKQTVQMIIGVPKGTDEVLLVSAPSFINPTADSDFLDSVSQETNEASQEANQYFLNREWFIDASQIRSQYIHVYSKFPTGAASPTRKLQIMNHDSFDQAQMGDGYNSASYGRMGTVLYEPSTKRLRFGAAFEVDSFLSFPAYLIPGKFDISTVEKNQYDCYQIKAPDYAEQYIIFKAIEELVPFGSQAQQYVMNMTRSAQQDLYTHIPQNTSAIEITDGYIG